MAAATTTTDKRLGVVTSCLLSPDESTDTHGTGPLVGEGEVRGTGRDGTGGGCRRA